VGAQASVTDLQAIRKFGDARRTRIEIVSPKWLQLCHQQQQLLPADSSCRIPLDSLLRNAGPAATGSLATTLAGQGSDASSKLPSVPSIGGGVFSRSASRSGFPAAAEAAGPSAAASAAGGEGLSDEWAHRLLEPSAQGRGAIFTTCFFTLVAMQGSPDHQAALDIIRWAEGWQLVTQQPWNQQPHRQVLVAVVCLVGQKKC